MKKGKIDFFWPSFADLMTSLFFVMLVLYVLTYHKMKSRTLALENELNIIKAVQNTLSPLKQDSTLFIYEEDYKRFKLAFDVKFNFNKHHILYDDHLVNPEQTRIKIIEAGKKLKDVIDKLKAQKDTGKLQNVSYILVIAGYASKDILLSSQNRSHNYELSYKRALSLWAFWRQNGIDFETPEYKGLIDLQIAGNGWGGVGRLPNSREEDNQRFLIQIFPKIGDIK